MKKYTREERLEYYKKQVEYLQALLLIQTTKLEKRIAYAQQRYIDICAEKPDERDKES